MTEPAGLAAFVAEHQRALLRAAWLLTGDWGAAEDLVQNALARVWPRWSSIRGNHLGYVRKTMLSLFLNDRRRRWHGEIASDVPEQAVAGADLDARSALLAALAALPPRQRAVIVLRYFADLTEVQTADTLGCALGTVKSLHAKALGSLRAMPALEGVSHA